MNIVPPPSKSKPVEIIMSINLSDLMSHSLVHTAQLLLTAINDDPCHNYQSLDNPWRATNESGLYLCHESFPWNGWYRLFYNGMDIRMPESCVNVYSCNAIRSLWLTGPHPQIEDGVVIREVCGVEDSDCCGRTFFPIRVKACPGNYYVYELVKQFHCAGYCIDVNTISPTVSITAPAPAPVTAFDMTLSAATNTDVDPCIDYTILDEHKRSPDDFFNIYEHMHEYDDTRVEWDGWYRFYINGSSAQMPEWCFSHMYCGGYSPLWLDGPHPQLEDGVVTRDVYGGNLEVCRYFRSNPIQVKACPGNYYVYKLVRPNRMIPAPAYCAVVVSSPPSVDPCYSYNSLDEPWRANKTLTDDYSNIRCDGDVNWNGWYRLFVNGQSAQMPESCVSYGMCGTYHAMWLNGLHPQLEDGVVTRHVCGSTSRDCCGYTFHPIQVKACPGNYYVYEFIRPRYCAAYCAVTNPTTMYTTAEAIPVTETSVEGDRCSELNCTEDERCEEEHGVYGCFCKDSHNSSQLGSFDFIETCESSSGFMSLSRCQLFEAGFSSDILHLNDPSCRGTVRNGRVEFYFDNNDHICGTSLVANGTHFIYENFILGDSGSGNIISREKYLRIHFRCVYSQTQSLTMDINLLESIVHRILPAGQGTYQVRMIPYQDAEFLHPYSGSVNVELSKSIFVEVRVDGVDSSQFASVIDTCWATPVNDPHYSVRWDLIVDMCPSPNDKVELLQNGVSTSSRFSFSMFTFIANSAKVYLHCSIHLCLLSDNRCSVHCDSEQHGRKGRSVDIHESTSISMGPLMWSDLSKGEQLPNQVQGSRAPCLCASLMMLLISMMSVLISF
ncbi:pancreatic secretory granule membrane major glycoprotein GP2-like [Megalobrama amblycephala]|uniref:pancreatic secretory granule membrane major glycoprotein GP2-like n=1 Tax=Megalobrama amblycephala TaxID=75352 RepID=UPI002014143A|nr:pancreatic secretory granule membrane major glycoprotein GP2-like [Megalobrama amblycephala]